jgi:hypothetical protein
MTWAIARRWLLPALRDGCESDLLDDLTRGDAQLWFGERAALVTQHVDRCLHIWLAGGDLREIIEMRVGVEAYARARGCQEITITGRAGWERVLRPHGYSPRDGELRKAL